MPFKKLCLLLLLLNFKVALADSKQLVVQLKAVPQQVLTEVSKDFAATNNNNAATAKNKPNADQTSLPSFLQKAPSVGGIKVEFAGRRNYTNTKGISELGVAPLGKTITVVITPQTFERPLSGSTVDHFALWDKEKPQDIENNVAIFEFRKEKESEDKNNAPDANKTSALKLEQPATKKIVASWNIAQVGIPADGKIPNSAVIIQANPENVYVPTGTMQINGSMHVRLPPIYLLSRDGIDEAILKSFGPGKLENGQLAKYNLLQNLREKTKQHVKNKFKIEVSSIEDDPI